MTTTSSGIVGFVKEDLLKLVECKAHSPAINLKFYFFLMFFFLVGLSLLLHLQLIFFEMLRFLSYWLAMICKGRIKNIAYLVFGPRWKKTCDIFRLCYRMKSNKHYFRSWNSCYNKRWLSCIEKKAPRREGREKIP